MLGRRLEGFRYIIIAAAAARVASGFQSRPTRGSTLLSELHQAPSGSGCRERFRGCWDDAARGWIQTEPCAQAKRSCQTLLCFIFLPEQCHNVVDAVCKSASHMCNAWKSETESAPMQQVLASGETRRLEFLHIPKNAGSVIEGTAYNLGWQWGRFAEDLNRKILMPDSNECSGWHVPPQFTSHYDDADVFCVVRHPYDRVVSEYTYLVAMEWGIESAAEYGVTLGQREICSAEDLNLFVLSVMDQIKGGKKYTMDCHFVPQADYIQDANGQRLCDYVIPVEKVRSAIPAVVETHGLEKNFTLPTEPENNHASVCRGLSSADLTMETRKLLDAMYAVDFALPEVAKERAHLAVEHTDLPIPREPTDDGLVAHEGMWAYLWRSLERICRSFWMTWLIWWK